jgi:hypothetical protein
MWKLLAVAAVVLGGVVSACLGQARERGAEFYFGYYNFNDELVADPEKDWPELLKGADGLLLHFGYWLNNDQKLDPIATARKLAPILKKHGKKTLMETGWPSASAGPGVRREMGAYYAREHIAKIGKLQRDSGLHVDELNVELRLFAMEQLASVHPELTSGRALLDQTAREWRDYLEPIHAAYPEKKFYLVCPPVYVPWGRFYFAGNDFNVPEWKGAQREGTRPASGPASTQSARIRLDGEYLFDRLFQPPLTPGPLLGYSMDSPAFLTANPTYIKVGYLDKLLAMQSWLRQRGLRHTFIVNASPDAKKLSKPEWDAAYWREALKSLQTFQAAGGRADRYLYESWYPGPFVMVPEGKENSATYGALRVLKYLRGEGEELVLEKGTAGTVKLTNLGDIACMPVVRATGVTVWAGGTEWADAGSGDGHVLKELVAPGQTFELKIEGHGTVEVWWNPQDGASVPRARLELGE